MTISISSSTELYATVTDHLRSRPEQVAFLIARALDQSSGGSLEVTDHLLLNPSDLVNDEWCVALSEKDQQQVLDWAFLRDGWLIEAHSHIGWLGDPACMSATDIAGLHSWVPHVRWRLQRRGYAALVFGNCTFDGLGWTGPLRGQPEQVANWITPARINTATQRSLRHLEDTNV